MLKGYLQAHRSRYHDRMSKITHAPRLHNPHPIFSVGNGYSYETVPVALFVREVQFISLKGKAVYQFEYDHDHPAEITAEVKKFVSQRSALGWFIQDGRILITEI
jgi:hypothetical protein